MFFWGLPITADLGPLICASTIYSFFEEGQNKDELFQFICSTCVAPKMVIIRDNRYIPDYGDFQFLIEVVWYLFQYINYNLGLS
jgi:hypothetical protein